MFLLQCPCILRDPLVKRSTRECDQSTHLRAEVTNTWRYPYTIPYICILWCSNNDMENITVWRRTTERTQDWMKSTMSISRSRPLITDCAPVPWVTDLKTAHHPNFQTSKFPANEAAENWTSGNASFVHSITALLLNRTYEAKQRYDKVIVSTIVNYSHPGSKFGPTMFPTGCQPI
jgi:hypothetical protein